MKALRDQHAALAVMNAATAATAASLRLTVDAPRAGTPPGRTTTFSAGLRSQLAKSPSSSTPRSDHSYPRRPRNSQNWRRSPAYARTVFGERSVSVNQRRNNSIGSTGRRSAPITVHDSRPRSTTR
jgi:hypothetical protein